MTCLLVHCLVATGGCSTHGLFQAWTLLQRVWRHMGSLKLGAHARA